MWFSCASFLQQESKKATMEPGLTSESSSTSSDGSNDFQSDHPLSDEIASYPTLPTLPRPGDGTALPFNQPQRNFGSSTAYHLPTSNLPQDFRLESSSRVPFPQMQQFNSQFPWTSRQPQYQMTMHDSFTSFGSQEVPMHPLLAPAMAPPNSLYPNPAMPYHFQHMNSPMQQDQMINWNQGTPQGMNNYVPPPTDIRLIRNSVYDPMYELMGLPVDPHLRIFVAKRNNGNED